MAEVVAKINDDRISRIAAIVKGMPEKPVLNFYSFNNDGTQDPFCKSMYPSLNHPNTIDFLSYMGSSNYGYWTLKDGKYEGPIFGTLNGKAGVKGSDLLWQTAKRTFDQDPGFFTPSRLADVAEDELIARIYSDDNGPLPFRDLHARYLMTVNYGSWFLSNGTTPAKIVEAANSSEDTLNVFLNDYMDVPGYDEDLFEKKNTLLAMSLANRPERFLDVAPDDENWCPIIDYHLMRFALRTGMVGLSPEYRQENIDRRLTSPKVEFEIRDATNNAVYKLIKESGRTMGFVDLALWSARKYCPEDWDLSKINCGACTYNTACEQDKELFQPVFETTYY
jgi:hypothetical protein